jgi:hypothetical protein
MSISLLFYNFQRFRRVRIVCKHMYIKDDQSETLLCWNFKMQKKKSRLRSKYHLSISTQKRLETHVGGIKQKKFHFFLELACSKSS